MIKKIDYIFFILLFLFEKQQQYFEQIQWLLQQYVQQPQQLHIFF